MNKNLLALAVSAAILAPSLASADVTVYGRLQVEYSVEDLDGSGNDSVQSVDDNNGQSRLGFKFKEKLGGGMTAFGKVEFRLDPAQHNTSGTNGNTTGSTGAIGARDTHVGIKSSWGSIAAGSFHSPYKTAGGVKWDPWTATHLQARRAAGMSGGAGGVSGHNGFMRNALYYTSPNVNGFKVQFAISPDETNAGANNGDNADNDYSLAVQYKNGPWHAVFAHSRDNVDSPRDDETITKAGLRWKNGAWTLAGQYEAVSDATTLDGGGNAVGVTYAMGDQNDADIIWLNAQYKAGNNIFTASYGNLDADVSGGSDYDYDYWAVGIIHKFSKKTRIFGGYTTTDGSSDAPQEDKDAWTVGIRKDF